MGCCDSKEMPNAMRLEEDDDFEYNGTESKRRNTKGSTGSMHLKHANRQVRNSNVASIKKNKHSRGHSVQLLSGDQLKSGPASTALPWKATVLTLFGPGTVTKIARRSDNIAEVTLKNWTLANNTSVRIYAPSFVIKKHHRVRSSAEALGSFKA
tara:strand:+ start:136 stop:597 length:462 start_codon:yes stop_codon:yes gene_type:complete